MCCYSLFIVSHHSELMVPYRKPAPLAAVKVNHIFSASEMSSLTKIARVYGMFKMKLGKRDVEIRSLIIKEPNTRLINTQCEFD